MSPLLEEFAILVEDLNAIIFPVTDIDAAFAIDPDGMRGLKLSGATSGLSPRKQVLASLVELDHAVISIAVGDKKIPVRGECNIGGTVKRLVIGSDLAFDTPGLEQLALAGEFIHLVVAII